jgi:hypothetical protein
MQQRARKTQALEALTHLRPLLRARRNHKKYLQNGFFSGLLGALDTETAHGVTGVASLILLADICDQRLRALHFDFEGGDQCIFGVNDDVSRFALNFKADRKLHLCLPLALPSVLMLRLTSGLNDCSQRGIA